MVKRGTPFDWLVVGLGNPGAEFRRTRHNVGQDAVELLAERLDASLKGGRDHALVAETRVDGERAVLAVPITYMNDSGRAVGAMVRRYGIDEASRIVVVHDELDLAPGVVRVKVGGGLAGHNGLRSIAGHLKHQDFLRVRIGVGKPPSKDRGAGHVLSRLGGSARELLDVAITDAADAVQYIIGDGIDSAQRRINGPPPHGDPSVP